VQAAGSWITTRRWHTWLNIGARRIDLDDKRVEAADLLQVEKNLTSAGRRIIHPRFNIGARWIDLDGGSFLSGK
jgi:hypothetical protein